MELDTKKDGLPTKKRRKDTNGSRMDSIVDCWFWHRFYYYSGKGDGGKGVVLPRWNLLWATGFYFIFLIILLVFCYLVFKHVAEGRNKIALQEEELKYYRATYLNHELRNLNLSSFNTLLNKTLGKYKELLEEKKKALEKDAKEKNAKEKDTKNDLSKISETLYEQMLNEEFEFLEVIGVEEKNMLKKAIEEKWKAMVREVEKGVE